MTRRLFLIILSLTTGLLLAACGPAGSDAAAAPGNELLRVSQSAPQSSERAQDHQHTNVPEHHGQATAGTTEMQHDHSSHEPLAAAEPLPGQSLYHLSDVWQNHRGEELVLADLRGRPVVVVMFYASCDTACPILVRDALHLEAELPEDSREETVFLMVTIDPEVDAPERLAEYVAQNDLDKANWTFLTGSHGQTRALAALLGVQYREAGNGMFSHTNLITVLDRDGEVVLRTEGLGQPVEPAVEAISRMG